MLTCGQEVLDACKAGQYCLVQQNIDRFPNYFSAAFMDACENNQLTIAQLLIDKFPIIKSQVYLYTPTFRLVCDFGYFKVADWMIQVFPNIYKMIDLGSVLRTACLQGRFTSVEWILNIYPQIDVSVYDNCVLRYACQNGDIKTVNLLQTKLQL